VSEEQRYIDPPPKRKDIPGDPIWKLWKAFIQQLRKRDIVEIKVKD